MTITSLHNTNSLPLVPQESPATGAHCGGSEACAETCLQHQKNQQGGLQRNLEENRSKGSCQVFILETTTRTFHHTSYFRFVTVDMAKSTPQK